MEISSKLSFIILLIVLSLVQTNGVGGNSKVKGTNPNSDSGKSVQKSREQNNEATTATAEPEPPIKAETCPTASSISPCTCRKDTYEGLVIDCSGSLVDQRIVEYSFREVRRVNGIPEDRGLDLYWFALTETDLTQFDLAPLYASRMQQLYITDNFKLTKLVTSGNPEDHGSINVDGLFLYDATINADDFRDFLKYFSLEMTRFYASKLIINPNNNNTDQLEFLPGLSAFANLTWLQMRSSNISGPLTSSYFQAFPKLAVIDLLGNQIDEIGENVFHSTASIFSMDLSQNRLNETSFHPNCGILQTRSDTNLYLESNQITTLPQELFGTFLDIDLGNHLDLYGNPLICDARLSWIKSRREEFQGRVPSAICSNDPGHTIFTSDLIP